MRKLLDILMYAYAALLVFLVILAIPSLFYFISSASNLLSSQTVENTCLLLCFEFGIFGGISMIIPLFRKIYDVFPWAYSLVKILFLDLFLMGSSIEVLNMFSSNKVFSLIVMVAFLIVMRFIMCLYLDKSKAKNKSFKLFGVIMLAVGIIGISVFNISPNSSAKVSSHINEDVNIKCSERGI